MGCRVEGGWILGPASDTTQELGLVDDLDPERARLLQLATGVGTGDHRVGLLAHAPREPAGRAPERTAVVAPDGVGVDGAPVSAVACRASAQPASAARGSVKLSF